MCINACAWCTNFFLYVYLCIEWSRIFQPWHKQYWHLGPVKPFLHGKRMGNSGNSVRLYFGGSKITADGDCSCEIKRCFLFGRKAMTNLDSILKSRDIILPTKVHLVKAMVFPVVTYSFESWTKKNAEHWRIDAFELWCWRRLLRVPWTARRSNHPSWRRSVLGVHWKDWCWSWNSSILATWWEELTLLKRLWCWERMRAGGEGGNRGWNGWVASPTQWTWVWVNSGSWWWTGRPGVLQFMGLHRVGHNWVTELNWTELCCGDFLWVVGYWAICLASQQMPVAPFPFSPYLLLQVNNQKCFQILLNFLRGQNFPWVKNCNWVFGDNGSSGWQLNIQWFRKKGNS